MKWCSHFHFYWDGTRQCIWQLCMVTVHSDCAWQKSMSTVHGDCAWQQCMVTVHGDCAWQLCMATAWRLCVATVLKQCVYTQYIEKSPCCFWEGVCNLLYQRTLYLSESPQWGTMWSQLIFRVFQLQNLYHPPFTQTSPPQTHTHTLLPPSRAGVLGSWEISDYCFIL